ncbi:hypothetical protein K1719_017649 [Acacia pycnantha]|nr:hypothetical protein K1719_017649 [Acacia pycnantha]
MELLPGLSAAFNVLLMSFQAFRLRISTFMLELLSILTYGFFDFFNDRTFDNDAPAPLLLGLQPSDLINHITPVDWSWLDQIPGERGGSIPILPSSLSFSS